MSIQDISGLGQPLTRLVEVIEKGVGSVFAPYLTKRRARADAGRISTIADAVANAAQGHGLTISYTHEGVEIGLDAQKQKPLLEKPSIDDRASARVDARELKRQVNIENITCACAAQLFSEDTVSDETPDDDWINRFFHYGQDVSSSEMQILWARILAGEIKKPGTFSLQLLNFVRNLTKKDAQQIEEVWRYLILFEGIYFLPVYNSTTIIQKTNIREPLLAYISELGALHPTPISVVPFLHNSAKEKSFLNGGQVLIVSGGEDIGSNFSFRAWTCTKVGRELSHMLNLGSDQSYLKDMAELFMRHGGRAKIARVKYLRPDGWIVYEASQEIVA